MGHRRSHRLRIGRRRDALAVLGVGGMLPAAACGGPGGRSPQPPGAAGGGGATKAATGGTTPIALSGYFETGFPLPKNLADEFPKQHPSVKWNIREDQFAVITQNAPRVLGADPPDLMRLPQV